MKAWGLVRDQALVWAYLRVAYSMGAVKIGNFFPVVVVERGGKMDQVMVQAMAREQVPAVGRYQVLGMVKRSIK